MHTHSLIRIQEGACVHAQTRVLEAYPTVVDFEMYTNPISEHHMLMSVPSNE